MEAKRYYVVRIIRRVRIGGKCRDDIVIRPGIFQVAVLDLGLQSEMERR